MIYPAHAGINRNMALPIQVNPNLPRTRGDKPPAEDAAKRRKHLPRTRGDKPHWDFDWLDRIISTPHTRG